MVGSVSQTDYADNTADPVDMAKLLSPTGEVPDADELIFWGRGVFAGAMPLSEDRFVNGHASPADAMPATRTCREVVLKLLLDDLLAEDVHIPLIELLKRLLDRVPGLSGLGFRVLGQSGLHLLLRYTRCQGR